MIIPPIPLYAEFGGPGARSTHVRVVFIDNKGAPWIVPVGLEKRLRPADSYRDFLGITDYCPDSDRETRGVIPAQPGWQCVFGFKQDDGTYDIYARQVIAWQIRNSVHPVEPIIRDEEAPSRTSVYLAVHDDCVNGGLLKILEPGESMPSLSDLETLVQTVSDDYGMHCRQLQDDYNRRLKATTADE